MIADTGVQEVLLLLGDELRRVFVSASYLPELLHARVIHHKLLTFVASLERLVHGVLVSVEILSTLLSDGVQETLSLFRAQVLLERSLGQHFAGFNGHLVRTLEMLAWWHQSTFWASTVENQITL